MSRTITFSIIIQFKSWPSDLEECLTHIKGLSLQEFEVILWIGAKVLKKQNESLTL